MSFLDPPCVKRTKYSLGPIILVALFSGLISCAPVVGLEATPTAAQVDGTAQGQAQTEQKVATETPVVLSSDDASATPIVEDTNRVECQEAEGRIERLEYSSQLLGEYVPVIVYLPPCYSNESQYPVLYLLHGKPQDENHWMILGVHELVNRRIRAGELSDLILVMPEQPEPLFSGTDGGPGSYEGEFLAALLPEIEANYSVSNQADQRVVAGISRGGVWALEIAFSNPEMFAGVAALSPALNVNDADEDYDPLVIAQRAPEFSEHIFIASGDVDSAAAETRRLHEILVQRGVSHRYTTVPGGHEGRTWEQLIGEMLDYVTKRW